MTEIEAKQLLGDLGKLQREGRASGLPCPRCGSNNMNRDPIINAHSQFADVYICNKCGLDEAIRASQHRDPLSFSNWTLIRNKRSV